MVDTNNHMYHNIFKLPLETVILVVDSLQKQVGCFNHRVVTMVADMLKRQCMVTRGFFFGMESLIA